MTQSFNYMALSGHDLFGTFHICAVIASVLAAVIAAKRAAGFVVDPGRRTSRDMCLVKVLQITGFVLAGLEIFKQLYLHFTSGSGAYDWWYFPFQLCSVPMYLCILLPNVRPKLRSTFLTFMGGYTFVSAAAALIYPEDILSASPVMVAHGFIWHAILLYISLLIFMTGAVDASAVGLARATSLFAALAIIAVIINVLAEPVMQAGVATHSYAAMFYLNPYHISPQPLVSSIQKTAGIPAGLLLYCLATVTAGSLATVIGDHLYRASLTR
jgi:uncharacterized membrane protein YwaF